MKKEYRVIGKRSRRVVALRAESLRVLSSAELSGSDTRGVHGVRGGGACSTEAPSGLCPTHSNACVTH